MRQHNVQAEYADPWTQFRGSIETNTGSLSFSFGLYVAPGMSSPLTLES
jgi:hypothetical protein